MNNKILTAMVAVLTVAVVALFFMGRGSSEENTNNGQTSKANNDVPIITPKQDIPKRDLTGDGKSIIAYVNGDMMDQKYLYLIDGRNALGMMQAEMDKKLQGFINHAAKREQEIQRDYKLMNNAEKEKAEKELNNLRAQLEKSQQANMAQLENKQREMQQKLLNNVQIVLNDYCRKNNIDYVLQYTPGGPVLYVNDALDITVDVLTTLNQRYQEEKKGKP